MHSVFKIADLVPVQLEIRGNQPVVRRIGGGIVVLGRLIVVAKRERDTVIVGIHYGPAVGIGVVKVGGVGDCVIAKDAVAAGIIGGSHISWNKELEERFDIALIRRGEAEIHRHRARDVEIDCVRKVHPV